MFSEDYYIGKQIYESATTLVFKAQRKPDRQIVILKVSRSRYSMRRGRDEEKREIRNHLGRIKARIETWSHVCPSNFAVFLFLVEAREAWAENRSDSVHLYRQAAVEAKKSGLTPLEAISHELTGEY
jgi:hypothetical protein